jgi:hypothetical protein
MKQSASTPTDHPGPKESPTAKEPNSQETFDPDEDGTQKAIKSLRQMREEEERERREKKDQGK